MFQRLSTRRADQMVQREILHVDRYIAMQNLWQHSRSSPKHVRRRWCTGWGVPMLQYTDEILSLQWCRPIAANTNGPMRWICQLFHVSVSMPGLRCSLGTREFRSCLDRSVFGGTKTMDSRRSIGQCRRCSADVPMRMETGYWLHHCILPGRRTRCHLEIFCWPWPGKSMLRVKTERNFVNFCCCRFQLIKNRRNCSEEDLLRTIYLLRRKRQADCSALRKKFLTKRTLFELIGMMLPRQPTDNEKKGRSSGSMNWRLARGEGQSCSNNVRRILSCLVMIQDLSTWQIYSTVLCIHASEWGVQEQAIQFALFVQEGYIWAIHYR